MLVCMHTHIPNPHTHPGIHKTFGHKDFGVCTTRSGILLTDVMNRKGRENSSTVDWHPTSQTERTEQASSLLGGLFCLLRLEFKGL